MALRVIVGLALATTLVCALSSTAPRPAVAAGDLTVLFCDIPAGPGDNIDSRGIVFAVDRPFDAVELMLSAPDGNYSFTIELRRSQGFDGPAEATSTVNVTLSNGNQNIVRFDLDPVPATGRETFSVKFSGWTFPGGVSAVFFNKMQGYMDCPDTYETEGNTGADPGLRGGVPWIRVLADSTWPYVWGDTGCSGKVDTPDVLSELKQLAGANGPAAPSVCPVVGGEITTTGGGTLWGDWDCSTAANADDALYVLKQIVTPATVPPENCRRVGAPFGIAPN